MTGLSAEDRALETWLTQGRAVGDLDQEHQAVADWLARGRTRGRNGLSAEDRAVKARLLTQGQPGVQRPRRSRPPRGWWLREADLVEGPPEEEEPESAQEAETAPVPSPVAGLLLNKGGALGPQGAELQAEQWTRRGFTEAEIADWLAAGLRADEWSCAASLRDEGISASLAARIVHGDTILDRIRAGRSAGEVRAMLIRLGHL